MLKTVYHPAAEAELIKAARVYNKKVPGLGEDLLDEIDRAVAVIQEDPTRWRCVDEDFRRYLVKRFPDALIYRFGETTIRILAVKHHKRHPDYWKRRKSS